MEQEFPIRIDVYGKPEPAGSKRAVPLGGRHSTGRWGVVDANRKAGPWKDEVIRQTTEQYQGGVIDGPLSVEFIFYSVRPKGHFGTGRNAGIVKDSAPTYPTVKPDALKLARAVEDALTGQVWRDDAQIVNERIAKRYGDREKVEINIWLAEEPTVQDLVAAGKVEADPPAQVFKQLELLAA